MKKARKLKGAEAMGVKVIVVKSFGEFSGKVLFPEQLKKANEIIAKLKM